MMLEKIIGWRMIADKWAPVYERKPGSIATAAIMSCTDCDITISPMGGGGTYRCLECFEKFRLVNFAQGKGPLDGHV
jgi:hypothetical protein